MYLVEYVRECAHVYVYDLPQWFHVCQQTSLTKKIYTYICTCHHESSRKPQHSKWNCVGTKRPRHIHMNTPKIRILQKKFPQRQNSNSNLLINSKNTRNRSNRFRAAWYGDNSCDRNQRPPKKIADEEACSVCRHQCATRLFLFAERSTSIATAARKQPSCMPAPLWNKGRSLLRRMLHKCGNDVHIWFGAQTNDAR